MCHANNEKRKNINEGRNGTTESRKSQNTRRKGSLQILGNIGSRHHQTVEMKEKIQKRLSPENKKTTRNQTIQQKSHQRDKQLYGYFSR